MKHIITWQYSHSHPNTLIGTVIDLPLIALPFSIVRDGSRITLRHGLAQIHYEIITNPYDSDSMVSAQKKIMGLAANYAYGYYEDELKKYESKLKSKPLNDDENWTKEM